MRWLAITLVSSFLSLVVPPAFAASCQYFLESDRQHTVQWELVSIGAALRVATRIAQTPMTDVAVNVSRVIYTGGDYRLVAVKIKYRKPSSDKDSEKSEIGVIVTVNEAGEVTGVAPDSQPRGDI